jgi:uncharacterized protein
MKALENIFVDSSAWIALADKDDSNHKKAAAIYLSILKNCKLLITSNLVIAETYIMLRNELGHREAMELLQRVKASSRILKLFSNETIEAEAERILLKYSDQDFSYADSVSFAIMRQQKIGKAFSFDKHFRTAGFNMVP